MLAYTGSTSTGTGREVKLSPAADTFGVQWTSNSTKVNYLLQGSIDGTSYVNLAIASTGRTGSPTLLISTQGPMNFVQLVATVNTSTTAISGFVSALNSDASRA